MITTVVIARHGNTFLPGEAPRRIGLHTDIPLVDSGKEQAKKLGQRLQAIGLVPDLVLSSRLLRSRETAEIAREIVCPNAPLDLQAQLDEIDHGPDEGKQEAEVEQRLGSNALRQWDSEAIMPLDWAPQPPELKKQWQTLLTELQAHHTGKIVLVITSNGRARFVPLLEEVSWGSELTSTTNPSAALKTTLKLRTGSYGILELGPKWLLRDWNVSP